MPFLIFLTAIALATSAQAATLTRAEPLAVFCIERLELMALVPELVDDDEWLVDLRSGVLRLQQLEAAGAQAGDSGWKGTSALFNEPSLAVEADAILGQWIEQLEPKGPEAAQYMQIRQSAQKEILLALNRHHQVYGGPSEESPITDPAVIDRIWRSVLPDLARRTDPEVQASIVERLHQIGTASGYPALRRAAAHLQAFLLIPVCGIAAAGREALARIYLRTLEEMTTENRRAMLDLLVDGAGGNVRNLMNDIEARRSVLAGELTVISP